jgi:hypothetical protein
LYNDLWDWRNAGIGWSAGSDSSLDGLSNSSGSLSGHCFFLCFKHGHSNRLIHPFLVGHALPVFGLFSATIICGLKSFKLGGCGLATVKLIYYVGRIACIKWFPNIKDYI